MSLAGTLACAATSGARSQAPERATATLEVVKAAGAEACIEAAPLRKSIEKRLERRVFVHSSVAPAALRLRVTFSHPSGEYGAQIELASGDGTSRASASRPSATHCTRGRTRCTVSGMRVDSPRNR